MAQGRWGVWRWGHCPCPHPAGPAAREAPVTTGANLLVLRIERDRPLAGATRSILTDSTYLLTARWHLTAPPTPLFDALRDSYVLEREIGRGGMATVYLTRDLRHHRPVALKVLHAELAQAIGHERFLREIETAAGLQHPHIVPLFDSGEALGLLYYVMPYVDGESLRARLAREKQLPIDEALEISHQVASALAYAHAQGVIHRDVKPENILLKRDQAVVADFGIARPTRASGRESLTAAGLAIGTPAYMSPEQASGERDIDGRSDVYSLACVLYEMLAGQPPFLGASSR